MFQRLLRVALWNALLLVTVVDLLPSTQAAFFVCPSSCEAKLLPRDMETLEDCICHGSTSKLHDNNHGDGTSPQHHGIFRCPEGSAARMLHPMSFADCACLTGFTRDDTHKVCTPEQFQCAGRYKHKAGVTEPTSIADCACQHPYTKDEATGECRVLACPRAGNYVQKSRSRPVKSLADCTCMDPFVKNDQSGECLIDQPFQCPPNSSPVANVRPKSAVDCHCDWGFVKTKKGHECVRESAAYICPRDSSRRADLPFGMQPRGFFDCECLQTGEYKRNEWTQSCDEIAMGPNQNRGEGVFSCPPFAKPLAAIPHSVEQCECLPGYGWKTPEMICVRMSAYACPAHSYLNAEETNKHVEETFDDCTCTNGYYRDETLQRCLEWFLANDNGCPKYAFLKHWPLQSQANCQCVYGLKPENEQAPAENASKKALRQQKKKASPECASPPSMTPEGDKSTFSECPVNAFANNWPLAHVDDCSCLYGFELAPISDEDVKVHADDSNFFKCKASMGIDAEEQALTCRSPMVMNPYNGACRLPVEEVRPSSDVDGSHTHGTVQFKGIEYDYVLTDENVMVVQGDIAIGELLTWEDVNTTENNRNSDKKLAFAHVLHGYYNSDRDHRWKDGEMCFQVDVGARMYDRMVRDAMDHITSLTGFAFKACVGNRCRDDAACSHDFVNIKATASSCYSYIGRIGGEQPLGVSSGCGLGNVIHVLLHAIGLHHTIDRVDRDDHVRVAWECVPEAKRTNFIIEDVGVDSTATTSDDLPYDFFSIMHHPADAFVHSERSSSVDDKTSPPVWCQSVLPIIADPFERQEVLASMGQRELLAITDIHAVWMLYPTLQAKQTPPTYISEVDADGKVSENVFESRLHTQDDVRNDGDEKLLKKGKAKNRLSQRASSFIGAIVTLCGFGAFLAFAFAEIKKRSLLLRGKDAYYTESLLTDKSLYD